MAFQNGIFSKLFGDDLQEYTRKKGNVNYLDGKALERPSSMPMVQRLILLFFIVAACILSFLVIDNTVFAMQREAEHAKAAVASNVTRQPSIDTVPIVSELVLLSDEEILDRLSSAGYQWYDASAATGLGGMAVYKIPSDMTLEEATRMYEKGIYALKAPDASKLLVGSWYLSTDHDYATTVVRYSDFKSSTIDLAIDAAMAKQGITADNIAETGIDEAGNTYRNGFIVINDDYYKWQISALWLEDMYGISGLPENAVYVGVRMTWYSD